MNAVVRVEFEDSTHIWTINRPQVRNAIDDSVVSALELATEALERDARARAVIVTGAGDAAFVAGADLKRLRTLGDAERTALDQRMANLLARISNLPLPVIGALNGIHRNSLRAFEARTDG